MSARRRPPGWFRWAVWAGIALAVAAPTACMLDHGEVPRPGDGHGPGPFRPTGR